MLTRDVTATMLVSLINHPGRIELNSYANAFFYMLTDHVSENTLKECADRNLGDTLHATPALAPRLEVLKYCFLFFFLSQEFRLRMRKFSETQEKKYHKGNERNKKLGPGVYAAFPLGRESHCVRSCIIICVFSVIN